MKKCVWCAEDIQDAAKLCRFCGKEQTVSTDEVLFDGRSTLSTYVGSFVVGGVLLVAPVVAYAVLGTSRDDGYTLTWMLRAMGIAFVLDTILTLRAVLSVQRRHYRVSTRRVQIEEGLVMKRVSAIDLWRVRDVVLTQGVLQRLVGAGDLQLVSSDEVAPDLTLVGVPDARALYDKLKDAVDRARRDGKVVALDSRG